MSFSVSELLLKTDNISSFPQLKSSLPSENEIEFSFQVKHNISRLWYIIRDANLMTLLCPDFFFPLIIKQGKDTWGIGTVFLGQTKSSVKFVGKCVEYKNFSQIKKLSWFIQFPNDSHKHCYYDYTLYKVTEDDSSVLLISIRNNCEKDLTRIGNLLTQKNFFETALERINLLMNQSCFNLFQFEGVVIDSNIETIWNFITHFDKLKKIAPLIPIDGESDNQIIPDQIGKESLIYCSNHTCFIKIKTLKYDARINWKKWVVLFVVVESFPVLPKYETLITVNKINEDECHISWFNDFKEPASYDLLKIMSETKKYILQKLQDFLENYISKSLEDNSYFIDSNIENSNRSNNNTHAIIFNNDVNNNS